MRQVVGGVLGAVAGYHVVGFFDAGIRPGDAVIWGGLIGIWAGTLAIVISNNGAVNNLDSAHVNVFYDNSRFYELCKARCGCPVKQPIPQ